jgi:putative acetyltransferase
MLIRPEEERDSTAVRAVNEAAFGRAAEARLVEELRTRARPVVSLVAEENGTVAGHLMFSPVLLSGQPELKIMGLGPMAVLPERQRQGIGTALARAGVDRCRDLGFGAAVVLGHPTYYSRFGFQPSALYGIAGEFDVPEEAFMVLELWPGFLRGASGLVRYHPAFSELER